MPKPGGKNIFGNMCRRLWPEGLDIRNGHPARMGISQGFPNELLTTRHRAPEGHPLGGEVGPARRGNGLRGARKGRDGRSGPRPLLRGARGVVALRERCARAERGCEGEDDGHERTTRRTMGELLHRGSFGGTRFHGRPGGPRSRGRAVTVRVSLGSHEEVARGFPEISRRARIHEGHREGPARFRPGRAKARAARAAARGRPEPATWSSSGSASPPWSRGGSLRCVRWRTGFSRPP